MKYFKEKESKRLRELVRSSVNLQGAPLVGALAHFICISLSRLLNPSWGKPRLPWLGHTTPYHLSAHGCHQWKLQPVLKADHLCGVQPSSFRVQIIQQCLWDTWSCHTPCFWPMAYYSPSGCLESVLPTGLTLQCKISLKLCWPLCLDLRDLLVLWERIQQHRFFFFIIVLSKGCFCTISNLKLLMEKYFPRGVFFSWKAIFSIVFCE